MSETTGKGLYEQIYEAVLQVPPGYVATYGDIAAMVGGCDARTVGYALNELPKWREQEVPWQRIINGQGGISTRGVQQRERLEAEGIAFDERGRVSLARFRWRGVTPAGEEPDSTGQMSLF
jgi:methylated-DNA-protein-cysteine methyltransferase-like protein